MDSEIQPIKANGQVAFAPDGTCYVDTGPSTDGPAVVLAHGVGLDHTMWDVQAQALASRARVVRMDMLGHGRTPALARQSELADYCAQLLALLDYLKLERIVLIGFSMGGVIAQRFSTDYPERLAAVVFMSTVYKRSTAELAGVRERLEITLAGRLEDIAERAVQRWFSARVQRDKPAAVAAVRQRLASNHRQGYSDAYRAFVEAEATVGDALTQVRCPALVITGSDDIGSTPEIGQRMVDDLGNARLQVLPGLRHAVMVEQPGWVNDALTTFLDELAVNADEPF